jgi:hypothetical protein
MKTRVNGSHLKRVHDITLAEYIKQFPAAPIGTRTPKQTPHQCKICNRIIKNATRFSCHLDKCHNMTSHNYYNEFVLLGNIPTCKCGCGRTPSFKNLDIGYHTYICRHDPKWNTGLTKETDVRIANIHKNRFIWNKGQTKETDDRLKNMSRLTSKRWESEENVKHMTDAYKNTMFLKYGVSNGFQVPEIKEKSRQTCLRKYGVENANQTEEVKEKSRQTCLKNYGVSSPMHCPEIILKQQKAAHQRKSYTLPSGKIIKVQGYEPFGLDELLKTYSEHDITTSYKDMPILRYTSPDGISRRYYPDAYIKKDNLIVEVKSDWTNKTTKYLNLKEAAVIDAGYNYRKMIFNRKGELINK